MTAVDLPPVPVLREWLDRWDLGPAWERAALRTGTIVIVENLPETGTA